MKTVFLIHENKDWSEPLEKCLHEIGLPYVEWYMVNRFINMSTAPPDGIFYNRMSASAHSRGHRYSPELTAGLLAWLESNDRLVINGSNAIRLELSKMVQYSALKEVDIQVPRTIAAINHSGILEAAEFLRYPIITKHNRAGKGLGVKLFHSEIELKEYVFGGVFEPSVDGITLVQDYIEAPDSSITRVEFVNQKVLYALRVDTSDGFELCPADSCEMDQLGHTIDRSSVFKKKTRPKFEIIDDFTSQSIAQTLVPRMERLMKKVGIDVAAFEFILDKDANCFVYDINVNTNYNKDIERKSKISGFTTIANFLKKVSKSQK